MDGSDDRPIPSLFGDLGIGVVLFDPETAAVLGTNDGLAELCGLDAGELRERAAADCAADGDELTAGDVEGLVEAAAAGERATAEWRVETDEGSRGWIRARFAETTVDGERVVAAAVVDVTDRKQRERKLERRNERLDRFAGRVAHDLRNPLQVAKERLAVARETTDSPHFEHIASAHDRMETIIDETLTLARQGEAVAETEPLDLGTAVETWWAESGTGDAILEVADTPTVQCDPGRLRHVFENLFRNAVEHSSSDVDPGAGLDGGGNERVTVTVGGLDGGFYVADDGPGIPPAEREEIFEAGYTTAEGGAGFGLTIVSEVVEAHGWEITVTESEAGGARFEITGVETVD